MRFSGTGFALVWLVIATVAVVVWWRIFRKAGYPGWMGVLMILPLVNLLMLLYFAFAEWPVEREIKALRLGNEPHV